MAEDDVFVGKLTWEGMSLSRLFGEGFCIRDDEYVLYVTIWSVGAISLSSAPVRYGR